MSAPTAVTRDELVHRAEARALYAALWDRSAADELRAVLPADAFAGRAGLLWALVCHHDASADPWPADEPSPAAWAGPGRPAAILEAAKTLDVPADLARLDGHAATLAAARRIGIGEQALLLAALAPAPRCDEHRNMSDGWRLDLDHAVQVLALAPAYHAASLALAQLDALAAGLPRPDT